MLWDGRHHRYPLQESENLLGVFPLLASVFSLFTIVLQRDKHHERTLAHTLALANAKEKQMYLIKTLFATRYNQLAAQRLASTTL